MRARSNAPGCGAELRLDVTAAFKDTTVTMTLKLESGHMLQGRSLGGMLSNFDKLMAATARDMGGHVQTLVKDIRVNVDEIAVDFLIASTGKREARDVNS